METRREVEEWIGKTPETVIPPRVKARVMARAGQACEHCGAPFSASRPPEFDHITPLINGGENRESNLQALHRDCHKGKTRADVAMKAKDARVRAKHFGLANKPKARVGGGLSAKYKKMPDGRVVER